MRTCIALLILTLGAQVSAAEPTDPPPDATQEALSIPGGALRSVPGTWGDPLRALGRFPGATTVIGGMGPLVVRGRLPDATPTYVDGVRVSWPFHALVGPAAISPELLDRADYYRGEAPARFGFLTGGVIDLHLPERVLGTSAFADLDLLTARATVLSSVGPLGTRVLASAAALYTPWLASRASNGALEANLGDWQLSVAQPLGDGELRLLWLGAYDGVDLTQGDPLDLLEQYSFARARAQMQRVDLRWRSGNGLEASLGYGLDRLALAAGGAVNQSDLEAAERTLQARVRWTRSMIALGRRVRMELGAEVERRQAGFELGALVRPQPDEPPVTVAYRPSAAGVLSGAWAQLSGTDGALTVTPGVRVSTAHLAFHDTEVAFEPRLWVDYRGSDAYEVHGGAGWYHQPVTTLVPLPGFQLLHLPEGMSSVLQTSAGVTLHPALGLDVGVDGYFDPMFRVVELPVLDPAAYTAVFADAADSAARVAARATQGSAMGLEVFLRTSAGDRLRGWLSYSFQRSARADPALSKELPFALEQSHVVNAVLEYRLPGGWTLSGAALLRTGAPEYGNWLVSPSMREGTDATGAAAWVRVPPGEAGRLPLLFRLDARASKAFDLDRLRLEVWLDVYDLNLARDAVSYSYGTGQDASGQRVLTRGQTGLWYPLPMLGVRGAYRP
ncbi:MAG TPA: TonB-dependent receptor [Myxococcaceae bacterium]|jgi:hypothetical protein